MSQRIGNLTIIAPEPDGKCELCGKIEETRPYGPHGERICFNCGEKAVAEQSPAPPKLSRSQKRYRAFLNADSDLTFREWLKYQASRRPCHVSEDRP